MSDTYIDIDLIDAVLEKPIGFSIGRKHYYMYPITLGGKMLTSRVIKELKVNQTILMENPYAEALRLATIDRDSVATLIAMRTLRGKDEFFNTRLIEKRKKHILRKTKIDELAKLFCLAITDDDIEKFSEHIGLTDDREKRMKVMNSKNRKNILIFGGKSIYGTLIDEACEKFGWTMDYVVWGISYTNLRMMLSDVINDVYLTDEEAKALAKEDKSDVVSADDLSNMNMILAMNWD